MNNKINKKRTDIESGNISAIIATTTSFVVILVLAGRISSTIIEKVYSEVEKEKEYEKIEQKRKDDDNYKDIKKESKYYHDESNDEDQNTTKLYYNKNFNFPFIGLKVDNI